MITRELQIIAAALLNLFTSIYVFTGQKFIKVAKSPMSPAVAFPFIVESSGISLLSDEGIDVTGPEINTIRNQGL